MDAGLAMTAAGGALFPIAVGLGSSFTHCAGMCGPIHLFLASRTQGENAARSLAAYHAGRILGYAALGAAAGFFGHLLLGLESPQARAAGLWALAGFYAFFGLHMFGFLPKALSPERLLGALFPSRSLGRLAASGRAGLWLFPAGLGASLLPCPSTHAVLLFGVGLHNPFLSGAAMLALGLATLPVFALLPRRGPAGGTLLGRHYGSLLGIAFLGLSAWKIYGAVGAGAPACH